MKPVNRYLNGMYDSFIILDGWRKTSNIWRRSESATAFCRCWLRWQMQYVVCNYGRIRFATPDALRSGGKSTLTHTQTQFVSPKRTFCVRPNEKTRNILLWANINMVVLCVLLLCMCSQLAAMDDFQSISVLIPYLFANHAVSCECTHPPMNA